MGVTRINIRNYKSIKRVSINLERKRYDLQCFIGINGSGKSNLLDAIDYFYKMLINENGKQKIIDTNNKYLQSAEIELEYDFSQLAIKNSNPYYDEQLLDLVEYFVDGKIRLKMVQYKEGTIKWYPQEMDLKRRRMIHKLFPIFFIDTRFVSLQNWTEIWKGISDISIGKLKIDKKEITESIDGLMSEAYGEKYEKTIKVINDIFEQEEIKIDESSFHEQYMELLKLRLGGESFLNNENELAYYSDGLNSLKYIKLIIKLIAKLSNTGWKNPLLIIDEPEIGLHSSYIEELAGCIQENIDKNVNMVLSTHSPHLVGEIIKNDISISIWRIFYKDDYSHFEKMKDIIEDNQKYLVNDLETGCYFSNALLFVEGKSERQLFCNRRLLKLYPEMKKINIVNYDSDNSSLDLIYPTQMNFSVSYLVLVDMDKILKYSYQSKKFKVNSDKLINPLYNKEVKRKQKFLFYGKGERKKKTYHQQLRINKMLDSAQYVQDSNHLYIDDRFFEKLIVEVRDYCMQYRTLPIRTTIEGAIVNEDNVEIAIEWLKTKITDEFNNELEDILTREDVTNKKYRVTIIRCCVNGKLDILKNITENGVQVDSTVKQNVKKISNVIGKKTGGWIQEFIEFYFQNYIDTIDDEKKKYDKFKKDFKELNFVLRQTIDMLQ
ncbi:retron Eco8 family effector endonuclease [uncultured Eubacterium sp.]|uniref:retron Eco8 family effector endonuclease n=1 Tax=Eubacterium sp. TaxID=142586 RepID=UPI002670E6B5|nr:retron Eco8 family effector endonuclease [uncultured Eubacterium sp.]